MSASPPWPNARAVDDFAELEPHLAEVWRRAAVGVPGALDALLSTLAASEQWHRVLAIAEVAHEAGLQDPTSQAWEASALLWLGHDERGRDVLMAWAQRAEPHAILQHARRLRAAFVDASAVLLVAAHRAHPDHPELALAAAWRVAEQDPTAACAMRAPHAPALGVRGAALLHATGVPVAEGDLQAAWEADPDEVAAALAWERTARDPATVRERVDLHLRGRRDSEPELGWALSVEWWLHHGRPDVLWSVVSRANVVMSPPPLWWRLVVVRAAIVSGQPYDVTAQAALDAARSPPVLRAAFELAVHVGGGRLADSLRAFGWSLTARGLDDECLRYLELADAIYERLGEPAAPHRANMLDYRVRTLIRAGRVHETFADAERLLAWRQALVSPPFMVAECHLHLATLWLAVGDLERVDAALTAAADAVAASPEAKRPRIGLERARARRAAAAGDGPAALAALERALALDPDSPDQHFEHALTVAELAPTLGLDPVQAWRDALDTCLRHLGPGDTRVQRARNHLAQAHLARGDVAAAAPLVNAAGNDWQRALLPPCADRVHTEVLLAVLDGRQEDLVQRVLRHIDPRWHQHDALTELLLGQDA